ncbi:2587_t:CDS:2 [Paraglomus brasilianum]|uniref:Homoserine kinase n=1 Tax=Paraglomus brasilianum TaxID=144538 RepID=A0A9N9CTF9_9GLOM|nr:2587_t:CDS:2 [Paraglomus brasilianum]
MDVERRIQIKVPCSSSNIGPGFDVLGLTLSMYLVLNVEIYKPQASNKDNHVTITYSGEGAEKISVSAEKNLITKSALYVLACHDIEGFPAPLRIHVDNSIPMGRGLGSSGAAVVAGVLLGDFIGNLNMTRDRILDFCLIIEKHPDNVTAALIGGFVAAYLRTLDPKDTDAPSIPHSETLDAKEVRKTNDHPPEVPEGIGHYIRLKWAKEIKAIAIIPQFEVATVTARSVLPEAYTRDDVVFNLQRLAVLTTALSVSPPNADLIFQAMQDRIHQPYRKHLIPGLPHILSSVKPQTHPGLLGICLSGAGPTILALAYDNFDHIAESITKAFAKEGIDTVVKVLEVTEDGAQVTKLSL